MATRLCSFRDEYIGYYWQENQEFFEQFEYAVLSCLDSDRFPNKIDFSYENAIGTYLGRCVCFSKEMFKRLVSSDSFLFSYNELWFSHEPPTEEVPLDDSYIRPYPPLIGIANHSTTLLRETSLAGHIETCDELIAKEILDWFNKSKYVLGIGDGDGMICLYKEPLVLPWTGEPGSTPRPSAFVGE